MAQTQEDRHVEIMAKLDVIEAALQEEGDSRTDQIEDIKSEIEEVKWRWKKGVIRNRVFAPLAFLFRVPIFFLILDQFSLFAEVLIHKIFNFCGVGIADAKSLLYARGANWLLPCARDLVYNFLICKLGDVVSSFQCGVILMQFYISRPLYALRGSEATSTNTSTNSPKGRR